MSSTGSTDHSQTNSPSENPSGTQNESASTSTTQAESSSSSSKPSPKCDTCGKQGDTLKECIKCHSVTYCSKDCQKADFKNHKKVCAKMAQEYAKNADFKMASRTAPSEGHRGGLQKWQFDT
ncbi:uncharacterized protein LY89DRAFT_790195 [Mollisia scopiformis]|uniref:MYND-type domain-containing protein n=1 Tax=Mollisia scopiformis TaxID=149040 RepID=A0A132B3A1_MOLSC|nr:uncharacterized protein LY89DRAFT_790195 [Mollisia scopiformis]KUJ06811.1 hypothetical protein LY89DRAFT_790195 [Mollisia scopiformis]